MLLFLLTAAASQQTSIDVSQNKAFSDFPDAIDFSLIGNASQPIERAILTYGTHGRSCTQTKNEIELNFEPTQDLNLTANWDVTQGSIFPLGAKYWWQWTLVDTAGNELVLEQKDGLFEDSWFVWESATLENVTIYWYRGGEDYAQELLEQALIARDNLARDTGLLLEEPVDFYLFNDPRDLGRSLPGAPGWAGGVAFPDHNIMMVAANNRSEAAADYGRLTTKHEFGHLVIGNLTFNCLTSLPTWLNEGLAQVAEGPAEQRTIGLVNQAVADQTVASLETLEGSFSIHGDRATLSYAQSDQFTRFLLEEWGNDGMLLLLETITEGNTIESAFETAYGLSQREVENRWRAEIGAMPLTTTEADQTRNDPAPTLSLLSVPTDPPPTHTPLPTMIPTKIAQPTIVPTLTPIEEQIAKLNEGELDVTRSSESGSNRETLEDTSSNRPVVHGLVGILIILLLAVSIFIIRHRVKPPGY